MNSHATRAIERIASVLLVVIALALAGSSQTPAPENDGLVEKETVPAKPAIKSISGPNNINDSLSQTDAIDQFRDYQFRRERLAQRFAAKQSSETAGLAESFKERPVKYGRSSERWVIPDGATEWGAEVGVSWDAATWMTGPKYYDLEDRGHIIGSLRWGKILGTRGFVTYSWAIEVMPLNVALNNEVDNPRYLAGSVNEPRRNRETTHGIGINPASFRFIFFPQYRLRPQLGAGFGITHHFKRMPTVEGTKMNFQVDFQIGGQYMLKEDKALNFGYRYYHSSNMYLFNFNPGYNMNMWFVGYSTFK